MATAILEERAGVMSGSESFVPSYCRLEQCSNGVLENWFSPGASVPLTVIFRLVSRRACLYQHVFDLKDDSGPYGIPFSLSGPSLGRFARSTREKLICRKSCSRRARVASGSCTKSVLDAASLNGGHSINFMAFAHEDNDLHPRGINGS